MKTFTKIGAGLALSVALVGISASAAQAATESGSYSSKSACAAAQTAMQKQGYYIKEVCHDHMGEFVVWAGIVPNSWSFSYTWVGM
jgi:hypothetical protein